MDRDNVIQYLAAMTDGEFHQTAAEARTLAAMSTIDDRLAAAQEQGDVRASIALKREKHAYQRANGNTDSNTEGPTK
jgi:hypothetical protein